MVNLLLSQVPVDAFPLVYTNGHEPCRHSANLALDNVRIALSCILSIIFGIYVPIAIVSKLIVV